MRFRNHELQRVVVRFRRHTLLAGQVAAPWFNGRRVKGIGGWAYLYYRRVAAHSLHLVQHTDKGLSLFFCGQSLLYRPVYIAYCGYPCSAELSFWRLRKGGCATRNDQQGEDETTHGQISCAKVSGLKTNAGLYRAGIR